MKKYSILLIFLFTTAAIISCENLQSDIAPKDDKKEKVVETIPGAILQGSFTGAGNYSTSGIASISRDDAGKHTLSFADFKTSNGPDLRIYLAEDTKATNFVEISDDVKEGNKSFEIPSNVDLSKQKFVLIWCKAFSVNFGYTELVEPK